MARQIKKSKGTGLIITSVLDMFTVLILYMFKNWSAEGEVLAVSPNLLLPESSAQKEVKAQRVTISVTADGITVGGQTVVTIKEIEEMEGVLIIPPLKDKLELEKENEIQMVRVGAALAFEGRLVLTIDKKVPFKVLYRVMATCGDVGYTKMDLAVFKKEV
jgi:biopolymer transport protein ExbD